MNSVRETVKSRRRAVALNKPSGHAKDAEKGREKPWLKDVLADAKKEKQKWPEWAKKTPPGLYSADDLRGLGVSS